MTVFPAQSAFRAAACVIAAGTLASLLAACDGNSQSAAPAAGGTDIASSSQQLKAIVGDVTVHITALQTSAIPDEVARQHGTAQRDDLIMLRVSPRQRDSSGEIVSAPVEVRATATILSAAPQPVPLEKAVVNGLVDHVGRLEVQLPATVTFQVTVDTPDGKSEALNLVGEFK